jgi:hypothetical protein
MTIIQTLLALASQRAPGGRVFQLLGYYDWPKLESFLLAFDFDQRRSFFGGGVSDQSIRDYCRTIDWTLTTIIARTGPCCLEAIAILRSLPPYYLATAELAVACPLVCDQRTIIAELAELALEIGAIKHRSLIVPRDGAHPDLVAVLRKKCSAQCDSENIRVGLWPERERLRPAYA